MTRDLSLDFRQAINAQESGEIPIFLVTIQHDDFDDVLRLSTDPTEIVSDVPLVYKTVSNGEDFIYLPMSVVLPDEREGAAPRSQIRISNVTQEVIALIRSVTTPAQAKIQLVLASALDNVEVESPWLDVIAATANAGDITVELGLNSMSTEMLPSDSFDPSAFPGLHVRT